MTFKELQTEQGSWQSKNFGKTKPGSAQNSLLGVVEEIGELHSEEQSQYTVELFAAFSRIAHHELKSQQKIRVNENHEEMIKDAVADIIIFLAGYCNNKGYDLDTIVTEVWNQVKQRDWTKNKETGYVQES